jgi:hypothetical protein
MVSFAPSTRVEASAVIPVAMRKLRRFSIFGTLSFAVFRFEEPERHRPILLLCLGVYASVSDLASR